MRGNISQRDIPFIMLKDGMLVRKQYIDALDEVSGDNSVVKVVTGMRGVGKTTIMSQYAETCVSRRNVTVLDYDFDTVACFDLKTAEDVRTRILKDCDGAGKSVIILHEVQKISGWAPVVAELVNLNVGEFFITASDNSVMNLRSLEGMNEKVQELRVTPLALSEFMELNNFRSPRSALESYLKIGGLPAVRANMPLDVAYNLLDGMLCKAILNDVLSYNGSLPPVASLAMARHIMMESGVTLDADTVSEGSGASFRTSSKILSAMAGCYMIFENEGRSFFNKLMRSKIVYYAADIGLRNCVKGYKAEKTNLGENAVIIELKRLGYSVKIEGIGSDRSFEATDDEGSMTYVVTPGPVTEKCTAKKTVITMDENDVGGYTLSSFLSDTVE